MPRHTTKEKKKNVGKALGNVIKEVGGAILKKKAQQKLQDEANRPKNQPTEEKKAGFFSIEGQKERLLKVQQSEAGQSLSEIAVLGGGAVPTAFGGAGGSVVTKLLGKVPEEKAGRLLPQNINVDKFGKAVGLTKPQTAGVAKELGKRRVAGATDKLIAQQSIGGRIKAIPGLVQTAKTLALISGIDVLTTWFAADNVATASKIDSGRLVSQVKFGDIDPEKALEEQARLERNFQSAKGFITTSTMVNPALWPFGKFYRTSLVGIEEGMVLNRQLLENAAQTTPQFDEQGRKLTSPAEIEQQEGLAAARAAGGAVSIPN